jgi:hypothetical protein
MVAFGRVELDQGSFPFFARRAKNGNNIQTGSSLLPQANVGKTYMIKSDVE